MLGAVLKSKNLFRFSRRLFRGRLPQRSDLAWALFVLAACSLLLPALTGAQNRGSVSGTVADPSRQVIVGASVTLRNLTTSQEASTSTDEEGFFRFQGLAVGDYTLMVALPGFKTEEQAVTVTDRNESQVQVSLQVASDTQSVKVSANDITMPVASQNFDTVELDRHWMEGLPSKEADPLAVPSLFVSPAASGAMGGPMILVDGVEASALEVPTTSIKRILVNKSPYSAEFARPGRGRIEVFTRKGDRKVFHGNLTFLARNSVLDARNAFARTKPPSQREIAEAELDGPLSQRVRFLVAGRYFSSDDSSVVHATTPAGLVVENVDVPEHNTRLFGRLEFDLSSNHTLTIAYKFKNKGQENQGIHSFDLPERATDFSIHENEVKVFERAILSSHFLNDLRFSYKDEPQQTTSISNQPAVIVLGAFNSGGAQVNSRLEEKTASVQDVATAVWGRHTVAFGGGARPRSFTLTDTSNFGGTFTFASLADYNAGQPCAPPLPCAELYTRNEGNPTVSFSQNEYFAFVQDEMQLRPSLSLSLGVRYEGQSNVDYRKNIAPRLAFAYAPGQGPTVLRGGFGIFYDRQPDIMMHEASLYDGIEGHQVVVTNPGYPAPYDPALPPPPSLLRIASDIRTPYLMQASLGIERKLGKGRNFLTIDYTMVRGLELYRTRNINAPLPATGVIPNPNYTDIDQFESTGRSHSNSLTASLQTELKSRLNLLGQYVYSKSLDDTSGYASLPADNYDLRPEYGRSDYDRRQRLNLIATYRFRWGVRAGTVVSANSGMPYNIVTGYLNYGDTVPVARPAGVDRNTGVGPGYVSVDFHLAKRFLIRRTEADGPGPRGNTLPAGRNRVTGLAGLGSESTEGRVSQLEIAIDAFNAFNHTNYKNYVGTLTSPFFGRPNAANPARQIQLTVRYHF